MDPLQVESGEEIARNQEQSQQRRKELAELLGDFKRAEPRAKMEQVPNLVNRFKFEVDALTRRARFVERTWAALQDDLNEAPDPVPALQQLQESGNREASLQAELQSMDEDRRALEAELHKLHNQDVTVRELEERLARFDDEVEQRAEARVAERERDLRFVFEEELASVRESERQAEARVKEAQDAAQQSQHAAEAAQAELFDLRSRMDEEVAARQSEIDVLTGELDKAHATITDLRVHLRKAQSDHTPSSPGAADGEERVPSGSSRWRARAEEAEVEAQRHAEEAARLGRELRALHQQLRQHREAAEAERREAREAAREKEQELAEARRTLAQRTSEEEVERLQQEIRTLRAMFMFEAPAEGGEEKEKASPPGSSGSSSELLLRRVRDLEASVIRTRRRNEELEGQLSERQERLDKAEETLGDQRALIQRFEEALRRDLGGAQEADMPGRPPSAAAGELTGAATLGSVLGSHSGVRDESPRAGAASSPADSVRMMDILREQRDRFRTRMLELEQEAANAHQQVSEVQARVTELEEDNVQLYSRIRYLQSLTAPGRRAPREQPAEEVDLEAGAAGEGGRRAVRDRRVGEGVLQRYSSLYEERLNPFADFREQEERRKVQGLGAVDRVMHSCMRLVAHSPGARRIMAVYALLLHALVFFTLWIYAHQPHDDCGGHMG